MAHDQTPPEDRADATDSVPPLAEPEDTSAPRQMPVDSGQGYGMTHWREATVTNPGLDDRGDVFFAAVEMTRMPMIVTDPNRFDNPIVFANRAFLDLTGYSEEEALGRNCRFLQGAQTDRGTVAEIHDAVTAQRAIAVEILNYRRDGTPFWNALFIGPIFDSGGKLLYFFASQLDITRRRTSEQAFRQAQKMEAIGQLTAGLAHDFNNLLQVVTGNLEMAREKADRDPILSRALENAERAAHQGARLTQQLLAFARKQRLEPRDIQLNGLVLEFSDMLARTLGEKVELVLDLRPQLPACILDPVHLEMALLNVLINARDAMPDGGRVTISTRRIHLNGDAPAHHLPSGDYVVLQVRDEGQGMPEDVLRRATEPFFTTKGPGKGTGLGLAMVHGFAQQSKGRLEIESAPGQGTSIRLLFPIAGSRPGPAAYRPADPVDSRGGPETILLVEDSDDVRAVAESQLRQLGYSVLTAPSGEEALTILEQGTPVDLLFTDVAMPGGMNGLVLANKARTLRPDLPVLLTTGYTDELEAEGPAAVCWDVLGKPYRRSELAERVRNALSCAAGHRPEGLTPPRHEG